MFDYDGEDLEDVAEALQEQLEDDEIVKLIAELYFMLETKERVEVKKAIS